jgi:hypothetical protein
LSLSLTLSINIIKVNEEKKFQQSHYCAIYYSCVKNMMAGQNRLILAMLLVTVMVVKIGEAQRPPPPPQLFTSACDNIATDELYYTGKCSFTNPHEELEDIRLYIDKANDDWTIDYFLKEYLFNNTQEFFVYTYQNFTTPINYNELLAGLKTNIYIQQCRKRHRRMLKSYEFI